MPESISSERPSDFPTTCAIALKEWAAVVLGLLEGRHSILLRKGGIHEGGFHLEHERFFLFPTYEHQKPDFIRPEHHDLISHSASWGASAGRLILPAYAEVVSAQEARTLAALRGLSEFHIWSDLYLEMRLAYKPEKPLHVILLRVFRLPDPPIIRVTEAHGGCVSWVPLEDECSVYKPTPVLPRPNMVQ